MIRFYRSRGGRFLILLWILFHLCKVCESRRYDKCLTRDGRQGVCVIKRYCREASLHALLPCDGDAENHCCPIPTTHRSAAVLPISERPDQSDREEDKAKERPAGVRDPDRRDDRLNKTPAPAERRPPPRRDDSFHQNQPPRGAADDYGREKQKSAQPHRYPQEDRNRDADRPRPPDRRTDSSRRDPPPRRSDPESDRRPPNRMTQPDNEADQPSKAPPIRFPESYELSVASPKVPACGVKPYDLFIAGGEASEEHEWPWMTAIFRRHPDSRPKTFLCGGSLINTKYVLTAAHCFVNNYVILPASSFVVRLGSHFLNSGEEYTVSNLVLHHNHSGSDFFNDIALVRLASEVYVTDKVAPICLPDPSMMWDSLVGRMATVAGWGDTSFRTGHTRILQHVTVPIVSSEECFAAYSRVRGAAFLARGSDHVICAGLREGGKDACLGDSGGPLMLKMPDDRWVVIGIVSLGYKCAEPGYPGVYTRVTHYMSWLHTNMKKH